MLLQGFTTSMQILNEHQNGPCGPYDHILQDGSSIAWFKDTGQLWYMEDRNVTINKLWR